MTDAPDPGLAYLIAAEIARHQFDMGAMWHDDHRACICGHALREADKQADHVAEHVALVVEQHTNGRIAELEAENVRLRAQVASIGDVHPGTCSPVETHPDDREINEAID